MQRNLCTWRRIPRALSGALLVLIAGCTSVPPSVERPQIGCEYDSQGRWRYALVQERDDQQTKWVARVMMTAARDPYDKDVHTSATVRVRPGYCPDESAALISRVPGFGDHR